MRVLVIAAALLTMASVSSGGPLPENPSQYDESAEAWDTLLDLRVVDAVLQQYIEDGLGKVHPEKWRRLSSIARKLPELYASRIPDNDGWGRAFLVRWSDGDLVVLSRGENGSEDFSEFLEKRQAEDAGSSRRTLDDIVLVVGEEIYNGPRTRMDRLRKIMADMRSIGTAIEMFAIDNNVYPKQEGGDGNLARVEEDLEPVYVRTLPTVDEWGSPYLFWSTGLSYVIVSTGSDGLLDYDYSVDPGEPREATGATDHSEADIVFANGQFVQWPRGVQQ